MIWFALRAVVAVVVAVGVYLSGAHFVRNFAKGHAEDDEEPVTMADVDYRFRCIVCGAEVIMYAAPDGETPMPPRHCAERMALIAPVT